MHYISGETLYSINSDKNQISTPQMWILHPCHISRGAPCYIFGRALKNPVFLALPKVCAKVFFKIREVVCLFCDFIKNLYMFQFTTSWIFLLFKKFIFRVYFLSIFKTYPPTRWRPYDAKRGKNEYFTDAWEDYNTDNLK